MIKKNRKNISVETFNADTKLRKNNLNNKKERNVIHNEEAKEKSDQIILIGE